MIQAAPIGMIKPPLSVRKISFSYGDEPVLQDVNVEFPAGAVTAILGPNGSGKSTLMHVMLGFLRPDTGDVLLYGQSLSQVADRRRAAQIAFVPQSPTVGFAYSVEEIVLMGRWPHRGGGRWIHETMGLSGAEDQAAVMQAMWDMDVHHLARRTFGTLSGGEQQRVTIARALALDAPILLLDEVTASLDLWHQLELLDRIVRVAHEKNRCIVWITHDLNQANQHSDLAVVMNAGRLVAQGPTSEVLIPDILEPVYRVKVYVEGNNLSFGRR